MVFGLFKKRKTKKSYHKNGKLKKIENFKGDKLDGLVIENYENGSLMYTAEYKDGFQEGKVVSYDENGNKLKESYFEDGKREGQQTEWWSNGKIKAKRNYKNGIVVSEDTFPKDTFSNPSIHNEKELSPKQKESRKNKDLGVWHEFINSIKGHRELIIESGGGVMDQELRKNVMSIIDIYGYIEYPFGKLTSYTIKAVAEYATGKISIKQLDDTFEKENLWLTDNDLIERNKLRKKQSERLGR